MKNLIIILCGITMSIPLFVQADEPLVVVPDVDINRYLGTWYEIARFPNGFQKQCEVSWVEYSLRKDGNINVLNKCRKTNGTLSSIKGKAWIKDPNETAKLKVQFFWPFSSNYWIIEIGENYEYAVVSEPKRKYLWILSRTKFLADGVYQKILLNLVDKGFDVSQLILDPWDQES